MRFWMLGVGILAIVLLGCTQPASVPSPTPTAPPNPTATLWATPTPGSLVCPDGKVCPPDSTCVQRCTDTVGGYPSTCEYVCFPSSTPTPAAGTSTPTPTTWATPVKPTASPTPTTTPRPISASGTELTFEPMREAQYISHRTAATYVFNDAASWDAFRSSVPSNDPEGRNVLPDVDFTQKTVLAAFSGTKTSGGYTTKIVRVVDEADRVAVVVHETKPGSRCLVTQNITYPGDIVTVTKTAKPVEFIFEQLATECAE